MYYKEEAQIGTRFDIFGEPETLNSELVNQLNKDKDTLRFKTMKDRLESLRSKGFIDMDLKS